MVCGFRCAENGCRTLVLEKNRKVGVKILMSGGTRCNVTHHTDRKGIVQAFGKNGKFLHSSLSVFGPEQVVQMFDDLGVPTKIESTGKIFPASNKSLHIQQALLNRLQKSGAELVTESPVLSISRVDFNQNETEGAEEGSNFKVTTQSNTYHCKRLAIASGGKSYPGCGTTGDGYSWVRELGHTVSNTFPALVPLVSPENWLDEMKGVSIQDSVVSVVEEQTFNAATEWQQAANILRKKSLTHSRTAVLFTHFGLSGPAAMNVSKAVAGHTAPEKLFAIINLAPKISIDSWPQTIQSWKENYGQQNVGRRFSKHCANDIADRLWAKVFQFAEVDRDKTVAELSKKEANRLIMGIHFLKVRLSGTLGYEKAEVTTGGVHLKEVNPKTMESKKCPNLYLIGEILDLDGWIGGYNFQSAFSTGWTAGNHMSAHNKCS